MGGGDGIRKKNSLAYSIFGIHYDSKGKHYDCNEMNNGGDCEPRGKMQIIAKVKIMIAMK
jgi:hypothetical protein